MVNSVEEITKQFLNQINEQELNLNIKDRFTFLTDINNHVSKILGNLIQNKYVEIATELRSDQERQEDIHIYIGKILDVFDKDNKTPKNLEKATDDLFEIIDGIEQDRINKSKESPELAKKRILDYLTDVGKYV